MLCLEHVPLSLSYLLLPLPQCLRMKPVSLKNIILPCRDELMAFGDSKNLRGNLTGLTVNGAAEHLAAPLSVTQGTFSFQGNPRSQPKCSPSSGAPETVSDRRLLTPYCRTSILSLKESLLKKH